MPDLDLCHKKTKHELLKSDMQDGHHVGKYTFLAITPQRFVQFARKFVRRRKICKYVICKDLFNISKVIGRKKVAQFFFDSQCIYFLTW